MLIGAPAVIELAAAATVVAISLTTGEPDISTTAQISSVMVMVGLLLLLLLWGCYRTRYEITPFDLVVHFGPFHKAIPLSSIVEVFPTHNPLSAPAPSLDRLRVNYLRANGKLWFGLISPLDKAGFVRELASVAPHLQSDGDTKLRLKLQHPL